MSPEFFFPVQNVGRHGYLSDIKALCWLYCATGCVFGCGIGQIFSLCGNIGCNFGACFSCHSRERLRRRFHLPPAFGLPPGIDDFLVHFFCLYCASHQEIREMALRGVDGPGMHILDVLPNSFQKVDGIEAVVAKRKSEVDKMLAHPPKIFKSRMKKESRDILPPTASAPASSTPSSTVAGAGPVGSDIEKLQRKNTVSGPDELLSSREEEESEEIGWCMHCCAEAPEEQMMERGLTQVERFSKGGNIAVEMAMRRSYSEERLPRDPSSEDENVEERQPKRPWSVGY